MRSIQPSAAPRGAVARCPRLGIHPGAGPTRRSDGERAQAQPPA